MGIIEGGGPQEGGRGIQREREKNFHLDSSLRTLFCIVGTSLSSYIKCMIQSLFVFSHLLNQSSHCGFFSPTLYKLVVLIKNLCLEQAKSVLTTTKILPFCKTTMVLLSISSMEKNWRKINADPIQRIHTTFQVTSSHDTRSATRCHYVYMPQDW